jgi:hypothetical protein
MKQNKHDNQNIIAACDDTCCQQLEDPAEHFITLLFKSHPRVPLKDIWHGVQVVSRQTAGFGHILHDSFIGGLWEIVLKWDKDSSDNALDHYMKWCCSKEVAHVEMMKNECYKSSIDNYITGDNIAEQVCRIKDLYIDTKVEDLQLEHQAKQKGNSTDYTSNWRLKSFHLEQKQLSTILLVILKRDALLIHYHVMK